MKLVCVADTHTFHDELGKLPEGDVFIHAGDLCRGGSWEEWKAAAIWLQGLSFEKKIVVAGNHDRCVQENRDRAAQMLGEGVIYLQDEATIIDGVRFWGSPWQPEYRNWAFNLPRGAALVEKWALIPAETDVLIPHGPPCGIGDWKDDPIRRGCEDLLKAVQRLRPALHVFGHIHQDGGFWKHGETAFANVTTWECERRPTVLELDPSSKQVSPIDIPPARCVK